ncbi:MAG TPA: DUF808 family protein [Flavobacteriaceae bacterium]|nr:DUF808 family protein [Flavobacteriaceae bacterium]
MASGIFTILDDIGALMDDVAVASKLATRKTAGILGDDLAVNAEKATGFLKTRELPVLWAITKGSFLNKAIIVPIVLALNYLLPEAIKYVLILGGIYLAFEGVEKIIEYLFHRGQEEQPVLEQKEEEEGMEAEKVKIKSAIITDFILSIEIIIIALSTVLDKSLTVQILTVVVISVIATVGVYGFVALIVRFDDIGYRLIAFSKEKGILTKIGKILVRSLPVIIKILSFVGTVALLLVSGGIFVHNIDYLHHLFPSWPSLLKEILVAFGIGLCAVFVWKLGKKAVGAFKK